MRALITDNDSTLMEQEILDEIAKYAGNNVFQEIQKITDAQMNGEIDISFEQSLKTRVEILCNSKRKITKNDLKLIAKQNMSFSSRAEELIQTIIEKCGSLKGQFFIFSGGFFEVIVEKIQELNIDESEKKILASQIYSNYFLYNKNDEIIDVDWKKSVMWEDKIINNEDDKNDEEVSAKKLMTMQLIKNNLININNEIIGLGDGSNDVGMIPSKYGYSVAYTGIIARENTIKKANGRTASNFYEVLEILEK